MGVTASTAKLVTKLQDESKCPVFYLWLLLTFWCFSWGGGKKGLSSRPSDIRAIPLSVLYNSHVSLYWLPRWLRLSPREANCFFLNTFAHASFFGTEITNHQYAVSAFEKHLAPLCAAALDSQESNHHLPEEPAAALFSTLFTKGDTVGMLKQGSQTQRLSA